MTAVPPKTRNLWAIILAGGKGARISPLSKRLIGKEVPKQYLPLLSSKRSLLQETQDRLANLVPQERTVVVVAKEWASLAAKQLEEYPGVRIVPQPMDRGTAAGILLPLCHVLAHDPHADVLVSPSDHHIERPDALAEALTEARHAIGALPADIGILGIKAENAATDLGWMEPGEPLENVRRIKRFVEKPDPETARSLFKAGGVWNTMVMVSRASTLWATAVKSNPTIGSLFEPYIQQLMESPLSAVGFSERIYEHMPVVDFSSGILERAENLFVTPLEKAGWFDCGTPERLFDWLRRTPSSDSPFRRLMDAA